MVSLDDTKKRIIFATMKAVRQYGLEGMRIQNVSNLAGVSPGTIYRYFDGKDQLLEETFTYIDKQIAVMFEHMKFSPLTLLADPRGTAKSLWVPYFRFWVARPDETIFYHRFRDSAVFPKYDKERDVSYFDAFIRMVGVFLEAFPDLKEINRSLLWLHVLTTTVMYAKYVVEGALPDNRETEDTIFQLLYAGLGSYLTPKRQKEGHRKETGTPGRDSLV